MRNLERFSQGNPEDRVFFDGRLIRLRKIFSQSDERSEQKVTSPKVHTHTPTVEELLDGGFSFKYYTHPLDEESSPKFWRDSLAKVDGEQRIVGLLREDDTLHWSNEARYHRILIWALNDEKTENGGVKAFLEISRRDEDIRIDTYTHNVDNNASLKDIANYFDRNITNKRKSIKLVLGRLGLMPLEGYSKQKEKIEISSL
jgi:hypothetical protein